RRVLLRSNDRVISQRGSFVIAPLNDSRLYESLKNILNIIDKDTLDDLRFITNNINFISKTNENRQLNKDYIVLKIDGSSKKRIKNTLEKLNINKSRIYPNLKEVIDYHVELSRRFDNK